MEINFIYLMIQAVTSLCKKRAAEQKEKY